MSIYNPKEFLFIEILILVFLILILYKWPPFIRKHITDKYPILIHLFWLAVIYIAVASFVFIKLRYTGNVFTRDNLRALFTKIGTIGALVYILAAIIFFHYMGY